MTREEAIMKWIIPACKRAWNEKKCNEIFEALGQEPCEDAIDRAEAMTEIMMFAGNVKSDEEDIYIKVSDAVQLLRELPSVNPQEPKTGRWIINEDEENTVHGHCSVCGWKAHYYEDDIIGMPYCPNCGAKMVEPQESEE